MNLYLERVVGMLARVDVGSPMHGAYTAWRRREGERIVDFSHDVCDTARVSRQRQQVDVADRPSPLRYSPSLRSAAPFSPIQATPPACIDASMRASSAPDECVTKYRERPFSRRNSCQESGPRQRRRLASSVVMPCIRYRARHGPFEFVPLGSDGAGSVQLARQVLGGAAQGCLDHCEQRHGPLRVHA